MTNARLEQLAIVAPPTVYMSLRHPSIQTPKAALKSVARSFECVYRQAVNAGRLFEESWQLPQ